MVNTRAKGTRKEGECLKQFLAYKAKNKDYVFISKWRSIANRFQNTDIFGDFDLAIAYQYSEIQSWYFIQVKSKFENKYYQYLRKRWKDSPCHCYLAVYGKVPNNIRGYNGMDMQRIKLPGFTLIRM